jgi:UDP-glucose 4-epimerase
MGEQTWLITGGAGYIGSHIANAFLSNEKHVVIYDSLSNGLLSRVEYLRDKGKKNVPLVIGDIRDMVSLEETFRKYKPFGIIHTAALKSIAESNLKPNEYLEVNYSATTNLLELANKLKIQNFIFSSTAAVYGTPSVFSPIKETDEVKPVTAYGESKLLSEIEVTNFLKFPNNKGASLRFFNVIGSSAPELADNSKDNLLPRIINCICEGTSPIIFGTDYPTPDGTCIRDYVDVRDIARAHLVIANWPSKLPTVINLGTGRGTSVRELINKTISIAGNEKISPIATKARMGDSAVLCADVSLFNQVTGFVTEHTLESSIISSLGCSHA